MEQTDRLSNKIFHLHSFTICTSRRATVWDRFTKCITTDIGICFVLGMWSFNICSFDLFIRIRALTKWRWFNFEISITVHLEQNSMMKSSCMIILQNSTVTKIEPFKTIFFFKRLYLRIGEFRSLNIHNDFHIKFCCLHFSITSRIVKVYRYRDIEVTTPPFRGYCHWTNTGALNIHYTNITQYLSSCIWWNDFLRQLSHYLQMPPHLFSSSWFRTISNNLKTSCNGAR